MKKPNPLYIERLNRIINQSPYFSLLDMKILDIGIGTSTLEIAVDKGKHLQPFGFVHGGVYASIIDAAAYWAVFYDIQEQDAGMTSVDLKLNYLASSSSGKLIARGRRIRVGKILAYAEADAVDENGKLLSHGTSTLMILPGKGLVTDPPLPPKFI